VPLTTDEESYPTWSASVLLIYAKRVEYKYVIFSPTSDGSGSVEWETLTHNRVILPDQDVVDIDDREFGVPRVGNFGDMHDHRLVGSRDDASRRTSLTAVNEPATEELKLTQDTPVIVAAYRLPIVATESTTAAGGRKWEITWDEHQVKLVSRMQALVSKVRMRWVGWPGVFVPAEERAQVDADLATLNCTAVWLESECVERFHGVLCEKILWPIFHDINELPNELMNFDPLLWQEYKLVNDKFRDVVLEVLASLRQPPTRELSDGVRSEPDRVVWIFDYELMLLPSLLMTKAPDVARAWFSTLPFPSSDVFRLLPMRTELLRGVLCSNLIGFLMFDYTRHFLYCCTRLLGLQHHSKRGGMLCVKLPHPKTTDLNAQKHNERFVLLRSSHVGVNPQGIQAALEASETFPPILQKWLPLIRRRQVVVGYDELHPMKGIHLKLLAFERLLQICPQYQGKLLLLQVIVNKHECGGAATAPDWYADEVRGLAKRINDAYSDSVSMSRRSHVSWLPCWRDGNAFLTGHPGRRGDDAGESDGVPLAGGRLS
jgi:trehalose 6-phosphate synthase/phosphatase